MADRYDGKHYRDRVLSVRGPRLENVPLNGTNMGFGSGLTGLDNMHPTGRGYAIIADTVLQAMGTGTQVSKEPVFDRDTLLNDLPSMMNVRHAEVVMLADLIRGVGQQTLAAPTGQDLPVGSG